MTHREFTAMSFNEATGTGAIGAHSLPKRQPGQSRAEFKATQPQIGERVRCTVKRTGTTFLATVESINFQGHVALVDAVRD